MHERNQPQRELFDAYVRDFNTIGCVKEKWLKDLKAMDRILDDNPKITVLVAADLNRHVKSSVGAKAKLTGDRRFHHAEAIARERRIERIALPKPGVRNLLRRALEKSRWFKRLLRFRAGIEGIISTLMRAFGPNRCLWEGWPSFGSYVGLGVVTYNLRHLAWALA